MVSLDRANAGMILSDAILDKHGQTLLAQGTVLTQATIASLRRHDVVMVPIALPAEATPPVDVAVVAARLAHLFRGNTDCMSATALLQGCITVYRLGDEVAP
jgi:hypothetical protein